MNRDGVACCTTTVPNLSTTISTKHHIDIRPLDGIDWASAQYIEAAFSRVDSGGRVVGCNIYIPRISIMFCFGILLGPRPTFDHHFDHDPKYATVVEARSSSRIFGNASSGTVLLSGSGLVWRRGPGGAARIPVGPPNSAESTGNDSHG